MASYERDVVVSLPEGDYKATARITVDEELRSRVPEWLRKIAPKLVCRVMITTEQRVSVPGTACGYVQSHYESGDDVDGAAQRFAADVEKRRAAHPNWSMALRMRAIPGEPDAWETFHYASGEWRRWGVAKRKDLPKEAVVEVKTHTVDSYGTIYSMALLGGIMTGGFSLFMRERAMADRR